MTKFATVFRYGNEDRIAEARPRHREYLASLKEQGKLFASGPFEDDSGALIIYEADSVADAEALIESDPFREAGVFQSWEMKPWRQVF
ncbi:MAG: YciI family protein [Chloroflexota bacterium]|nr:YciI family protein [Chloroflexota bacterium]